MIPKLKMSAGGPISFTPATYSGAMYIGVPKIIPDCVSGPRRGTVSTLHSPVVTSFIRDDRSVCKSPASPKSTTLMSGVREGESSRMMFPGLRSRWTKLRACTASSALAVWAITSSPKGRSR